MSQETVFRIDAVIGGHSGGFKLAAKEASRATNSLRNETTKYRVAQGAANREAEKGAQQYRKMSIAQREAREATQAATRAAEVAADVAKQQQLATRGVLQEIRRLNIAERFRAKATKDATREDEKSVAVAKESSSALKDEAGSAIEAAAALGTKAKETKKTTDRQAELEAVAKLVHAALNEEAEAARHAAMMLALKGYESKRTARDQADMVVQVARSRAHLAKEREELRALNFEFSRHRGVLASNIRSQPLFALSVAAITATLGPLSSALGDVSAGVVALGGGLEPLMGNLILLPSIVGTAAQGIGTLGLAFHGVFKTLMAQGKTYQNDLAKLSKPAQEFVKTLRGGAIGNAFKELQLQVQTGLFPGLVKGIKSAMGILKPFSQVAFDTAKMMGHLAQIWGKFIGSKEFGHMFLAIGERNRQTMFRMGEAAKYVVDAISKALVAAGPFIGHITQGIVDASKAIDDFITKKKNNGDLREYFKEVEKRTSQWLHILGSTISFFHNIFEAAKPLTDTIINAWVKGAKAAADWAKNNADLKQFFISARGPLGALARLAGSLAKAIAELANQNQENLVLLANALSQHVVPALHAVADFFAELIPSISKTLAVIADSFKTILANAGDLRDILKVALGFIRGIAKAAAWISDKLGGVGLVIIGAGALGALRVAVGLTKTLLTLVRDKAFGKLGIEVLEGSNRIGLQRGKGLLGGLIPAKKGGESEAKKIGKDIAAGTTGGVVARTGVGAALSKVLSFAKGGVARIPVVLAVSAVAASAVESQKQSGQGIVGRWMDAIVNHKSLISSKGAASGLADIGHIITGGLIPKFKDFKQIDAAGDKMMDRVLARAQEIAKRRHLSIPVDFDVKHGDMPRKAFTDFIQSLEHTVSTTKNKTASWKSYFDELKVNVGMNMKRIAQTTRRGSEDARQAFAANFNTAAHSVMKSMQDMGRFTKKGIATVEKYLRQALALYGVTGRDATTYINTYVNRHRSDTGSLGTGANEGNANNQQLGFKAEGGFVTAPGLRGKDKRHTVLGDGEAVLTHGQQGYVDSALKDKYGFGLRGLFAREKRPHYMNQGGFVAHRQWPMLSGDTDFGTTLGNRLERLAEKVGQHVFVQSGGRTLSEQAALYAKYGPGRAAPPTPRAPHVRGIAADITPGQSVFGGSAGQFGLGFPVPGEAWHIQLIDGSDAGGKGGKTMGGVAAKIKRVLIKSGGLPGAIGQSAVDTVRGAAQRIVNDAASSMGGGDGAAPSGHGISGKGHPGQNMNIARGMLRQFGWGMDQWGALKSLWTGESGWDEWAVNKGSGAAGIPQALGHGNVFALGDAVAQIRWGLNYIKGRYGSPQNAYSTWLSRSPHWYGLGGIVGDPRLIGTAASRTPPPTIPLNQAPSTPGDQTKKLRQFNSASGKYETHTRAEWEKIREKNAAAKKHRKKGPTGKPPIGKRHNKKKNPTKKPTKKVAHSKMFRGAVKDIAALDELPALVSGAEFERVAAIFNDQIDSAQKNWGLSDEQQIIGGLFDIASGNQVAPMSTYNSDQFEIRDVLNWDGGIDASSLSFVPGINQHVAELNQNLGMENKVEKYLNWAVAAYQKRLTMATDYVGRYYRELGELSQMVSFLRDRKDSAQKQYDHETRRSGSWQDRVAWNQDEISALRKWLSDNSDATTNAAKSYKHQAHHRIADLEDDNRHLRATKPARSKKAKDSLKRLNIYGNDLKGLTGKGDPNEPPLDVSKWGAGGIVGGVIKTFKNLQSVVIDTGSKLTELTTDDNSGLPAHDFNITQIKNEIAEWQGSHLAAQAVGGGGAGDDSALNGLLKQQLEEALRMVNISGMETSVFQGIAPYIGRFQHGGWVPQSGLAMLERGEYVVPEPDGPNPVYNNSSPQPVNVTLVLDGHAGQLVKLVDKRIESKAPVVVNQVIGRKHRMITNAPGRP